jgi:hypothetical protein
VRPEARKDFRYRIVGRDLLGDHLVYRIAFEPRSLIGATEPGGLVWVDDARGGGAAFKVFLPAAEAAPRSLDPSIPR